MSMAGPVRPVAAVAHHGGIPVQQNGKWLIFGKNGRCRGVIARPRVAPPPPGRLADWLLCSARVSSAGRPGGLQDIEHEIEL
jgi:hypothetical protein